MSDQTIVSNSIGNDGRYYRITTITKNGKIVHIKKQIYEKDINGDMVLYKETSKTGGDLKDDTQE